jgi:hypothetical protein
MLTTQEHTAVKRQTMDARNDAARRLRAESLAETKRRVLRDLNIAEVRLGEAQGELAREVARARVAIAQRRDDLAYRKGIVERLRLQARRHAEEQAHEEIDP